MERNNRTLREFAHQAKLKPHALPQGGRHARNMYNTITTRIVCVKQANLCKRLVKGFACSRHCLFFPVFVWVQRKPVRTNNLREDANKCLEKMVTFFLWR